MRPDLKHSGERKPSSLLKKLTGSKQVLQGPQTLQRQTSPQPTESTTIFQIKNNRENSKKY